MEKAVVGVVMGSQSDWETMQHAAALLDSLHIAYGARIVSAHRTPEFMHEYAQEAAGSGLKVIIAGAGGAAHLPGMIAGLTPLPVIGVPVQSKALNGMDSLLSIVQMPPGVPVGTMAIGVPGAKNAALYAARILGVGDSAIRSAVEHYATQLRDDVLAHPFPENTNRADS